MSATNNVNTLACTVYNVYNMSVQSSSYIAHMHNLSGLSVTSKCAVHIHNDHVYMVKKKIPLIVNFATLISKYTLNGGESTGTFFMVYNPLKKEPKTD